MARVTGALFSLVASGTIADTLTFAKWKGIQYVRTRVIPANPRSDAQVEVRNVFRTLNDLWKRMSADARAPWDTATRGLPLTDRNLLIKENVGDLIDSATMAPFVCSPGHGAALPADSVAITGQAGTIRFVVTPPTAPDGYELTHCVGIGIPDGTPGDPIVRKTYVDAHAAPDYDFALSVGAAGQYYAGLFLRWKRTADDVIFHSRSVQTLATVT